MTPELTAAILEQHAQLLEQNRELIALLKGGGSPAVATTHHPKPMRTLRKENQAGHATAWFHGLSKSLHPQMAATLKKNLQKRKLWQE